MYRAPGTPVRGWTADGVPHDGPKHLGHSCQDCYRDDAGGTRCGGCWIGPFPSWGGRDKFVASDYFRHWFNNLSNDEKAKMVHAGYLTQT